MSTSWSSWENLPGSLEQASVNSKCIWGRNRKQEIYVMPLDRSAPWERICGSCTEVEVGPQGAVYCANAAGRVYYREGSNLEDHAGHKWIPVNVAAVEAPVRNMAVGKEFLYVVTEANKIFSSPLNEDGSMTDSDEAWTQYAGALTRIAVGPQGALYGVTASNRIYKHDDDENTWVRMPGGGCDIAVSNHEVMVVNKGQQIFSASIDEAGVKTAPWIRRSGAAVRISANEDNATVVCNAQKSIWLNNKQSTFMLKASNGNYVRADEMDDWKLVANDHSEDVENQAFTLHRIAGENIAIQAANGKFWRVDAEGVISATGAAPKLGALFTLGFTDDKIKSTLRSVKFGTYFIISAEDGVGTCDGEDGGDGFEMEGPGKPASEPEKEPEPESEEEEESEYEDEDEEEKEARLAMLERRRELAAKKKAMRLEQATRRLERAQRQARRMMKKTDAPPEDDEEEEEDDEDFEDEEVQEEEKEEEESEEEEDEEGDDEETDSESESEPEEEYEENEEEEQDEEDEKDENAVFGLPSLTPAEDFDAEGDAKALRKAFKGFGTDDAAVIDIIGCRSHKQLANIFLAYQESVERNLIKDIKSELSGNYRELVFSLLRSPSRRIAYYLKESMRGIGTREKDLIELLVTIPRNELDAVKKQFAELNKGAELGDEVYSETSGKLRKVLTALVDGKRDANEAEVDDDSAKLDAERLHKAGEGKFFGTNSKVFIEILTKRSWKHLRAVIREYASISDFDLEKSIYRESRGSFCFALASIVQRARSPANFFAERLHEAMGGVGTDEAAVMRIFACRAEKDLKTIEDVFGQVHGKTLSKKIKQEFSGDLENLLLKLLHQE